jgi:hypothetical protein
VKKPKEPKPKAETASKPRKKKDPVCSIKACKKPAVSQGYCRLHYFAHWREMKEDEKTRAERRLNAYVDRLAKRYPDDYLEKIKEGIEDEEAFKKTIEQLDIEGDSEEETEREFLEKFSRTVKNED